MPPTQGPGAPTPAQPGRDVPGGTPDGGVRVAVSADVASLAALEQTVFGGDAWSPAALAGALGTPGTWGRVATGPAPACRDAPPVGYALARCSGDVIELLRLAVAPAHRRRGLGARLLALAVLPGQAGPAAAGAPAADRVLVEVSAGNRAALGFYAAAGFTGVDRRPRYYADGSDALVLRRSLARGCGWG